MSNSELMTDILQHLRAISDDKRKLEKLQHFIQENWFPEELIADEELVVDIKPDTKRIVVPEAFEKLVPEIASNIECDTDCYLNPETFEVSYRQIISDEIEFDFENEDITDEEFEELYGITRAEHAPVDHNQWNECVCFDKLTSSDSFRIMEAFTDRVTNKRIQSNLVNALNRKRPFANFRNELENTGDLIEKWYAFKKNYLENHVRQTFLDYLEENSNEDA